MHEILFRGKTEEGKWVYGSLLDLDKSSEHIWIVQNKTLPSTIPFVDLISLLAEKVVRETVGQYTGLTDKNGTKIFEGDLVSTDIARPFLIVEFRDGCFMFNCNDGDTDYYDIMLPILDESQTVYKYGEVIGNIHDNYEPTKWME